MEQNLTVLCVFLIACGGSASRAGPAQRADETKEDAGPPAWRRTCEEYAGAPVTLSYEDASGGAAVLYRTEGNVEALRERIEEVARFHNDARPKVPDIHDLYNIPHTAQVEAIDGGVKLVLVPKRAANQDLAELRQHVQQDVFLMQRNGCGRGQEAL